MAEGGFTSERLQVQNQETEGEKCYKMQQVITLIFEVNTKQYSEEVGGLNLHDPCVRETELSLTLVRLQG